jgi:SAM-dependent methyltransferase
MEDPDGISWLHKLPSEPPFEREDFLLALARGKRVVHLGFVDEHVQARKVASGRWLHARLADVALELVGIDIEPEGVAWARAQGYEAFVADCQDSQALAELPIAPVQLIVAGEIIEHLEAPGTFLRACLRLLGNGGQLVVTTPNAAALQNFLAPVLGIELNHPDHLAMFSARTLSTLFERTDWHIDRLGYYQRPDPPWPPRTPGEKALRLSRRVIARVLRWRPHWADGLIVVASPRSQSSEPS